MITGLSENETFNTRRSIDVYGYAVIRGAMANTVVHDLLEVVSSLHSSTANDNALFDGRPERDKLDLRVYNLQSKDLAFVRLADDPVLHRLMRPLLNDPYYRWIPESESNFILLSMSARSSGNALPLHIDSRIPFPGSRPISLQVGVALESSRRENGCTIVVPGSHRSGEYTDREFENFVDVELEMGDIVIWDSRLWHGTRKNCSDRSRWMIIMSFGMWWMKQDVDIPRNISQEIFDQLSERQKQLMGYLSMPPKSEYERINIKCGYEFLSKSYEEILKDG